MNFIPSGFLRNRHLQSIFAGRPPRSNRVAAAWRPYAAETEELIVDCGDGVRLLGYRSLPRESNGRMVVLIHGWEGHADSTYMQSSAMSLLDAGYAVFRLNLRDHGPSQHLNEDLFHSCRLDEVVGAVRWIAAHNPDYSLSLAGFSLGGNFSLRVAAAAGDELGVDRVVAICPVLNPADTMVALDSGLFLYRYFFIRKWSRSLKRKRAAFPHRYEFGDLGRFKTLEHMTDYFVTEFTEYPDLHSYLRGYSLAGERLADLTTRSTILLAEDDPIIPIEGLDAVRLSPEVQVVRTQYGGHCGYIEHFKPESWLDSFMLRHLESD